ncbi:MAG TPA: 2-dehydropantoate 2-reductase [Candidatus Acidoferrales bacterium]|nr:2-dehydropantoate 2-reductase [Candidatus Acidoferrales bacterium]
MRSTPVPKSIAIIGAGSIGSLYAAHLARRGDPVWVFTRRPEHARALNEHGLRVSGTHDFLARVSATSDPAELPECEFGIVATKALQTEQAFAPVAGKFDRGAVCSAQNGLGLEEVLARHTRGYVIRGTTFMSGTRHSDTHVEYELDTPTSIGPFEPTKTPFALVEELAAMIVAGGLKAIPLADARPAQWSKVLFNSAVNGVSALTGLPHSPEFADRAEFFSLGHLLFDLLEEGKRVAAALGVVLHEDPWEMNKIGAQTNHPPSMLRDVQNQQATEVEFLAGAIAREAARVGVPAPLHTAVYRLIKGKEASWDKEAAGKTGGGH